MATLLTITQLGDALDLNVNWLRREARAGRIPSVKINGMYRFAPSEVIDVLTERIGYLRDRSCDPVELVSITELARRSGISPPHLKQRAAAREVPHFVYGRQLLFAPEPAESHMILRALRKAAEQGGGL